MTRLSLNAFCFHPCFIRVHPWLIFWCSMPDSKVPTMAEARKEASGILFAIAILQLICGGLLIALAPQIMGAPIPDDELPLFVAEWFGIAVAFGLLGVWARVTPLPPVVVGLFLYVGLA